MGNCSGKPSSESKIVNKPHIFRKQYKTTVTLGAGAFSTVKLAVNLESNEEVAVKIVDRHGISEVDESALKQEVEILMSLKHPNIIACYDFYEEDKAYYVVLEYMEGGELFDRIVKKNTYNELEAREVVRSMINAIKYCHDRDVVHRDLKPENLLLPSKSIDYNIKIADFGFASRKGDMMQTQCGTPGYIAPEILEKQPYGKTVDMWSVGVITYILLGGYPPFQDKNIRNLFSKIKKCEYKFHPEVWSNVSDEAKDFIRSLLIMPPIARLTADTALKHTWINLANESLSSRDLGPTLREFKRFNGTRKFRSAVFTIMAINRMIELANMRTPRSSISLTPNSNTNPTQQFDFQDIKIHEKNELPNEGIRFGLSSSERDPIPKGVNDADDVLDEDRIKYQLNNDDSTYYISAINNRLPSETSDN